MSYTFRCSYTITYKRFHYRNMYVFKRQKFVVPVNTVIWLISFISHFLIP